MASLQLGSASLLLCSLRNDVFSYPLALSSIALATEDQKGDLGGLKNLFSPSSNLFLEIWLLEIVSLVIGTCE